MCKTKENLVIVYINGVLNLKNGWSIRSLVFTRFD